MLAVNDREKCVECIWYPYADPCDCCHHVLIPDNWERTDRAIYCSCGHPFDVTKIKEYPVKCPRCDEPFWKSTDFYTYRELSK